MIVTTSARYLSWRREWSKMDFCIMFSWLTWKWRSDRYHCDFLELLGSRNSVLIFNLILAFSTLQQIKITVAIRKQIVIPRSYVTITNYAEATNKVRPPST